MISTGHIKIVTIFSLTVLAYTLGHLTMEPAFAELLVNSDWETGKYESYGYEPSGNKNTRIVERPEPVCKGQHSIKFSLDYDDPVSYRSELLLNGALPWFQLGKMYWIGFSIYLPKDWAMGDEQTDILFQMHRIPDVKLGERYGGGPMTTLSVKDDRWVVERKAISDKITKPAGDPDRFSAKGKYDLGPIETGRWTDFVYKLRYDYHRDGDGVLKVWKDGTQDVNYRGALGYNDDRGPYLKLGNYRPAWRKNVAWAPGPEGFDRRVHYLDELRIGDATATYADVAPKCGGKDGPQAPTGIHIVNGK